MTHLTTVLAHSWSEHTQCNSGYGPASAAKYERLVRKLIVAGKRFPSSRFTADVIRKHLRSLDCVNPTRNRSKSAFSSFAKFLVDEGVIERNVVRDIDG